MQERIEEIVRLRRGMNTWERRIGEALKGNMSEENRQFHIRAFIKYYEVK